MAGDRADENIILALERARAARNRLMPKVAEQEAVAARQRAKGIAKYHVSLGNAGLKRGELLEHAKEEATDLIEYLEAALEAHD